MVLVVGAHLSSPSKMRLQRQGLFANISSDCHELIQQPRRADQTRVDPH